jgi:hypothetical protein
MQKLLLLGDEAIAQGAIDAGISAVYAYPGTPSTEITEYIQASKDASKKISKPCGRPMRKRPWKLPLACLMPGKNRWSV